jgi:hypothetical protein
VLASYAFDWVWGGGRPWAFHVTNLVLHGAVTGLTFLTFRRWSIALVPALLATAFFSLHPSKSECVSWISGRTDVLSVLGMLLALCGIARRAAGERGGIALEVAGTLVAYLSKEVAVVLPVLALVEGWVALGRPALGREVVRDFRRVLPLVLPQIVCAVIYLALREWLLPLRSSLGAPIPGTARVGFVFETFGRLVATLAWPDDLSLSASAVRRTAEGFVWSRGFAALGVLAALALSGAAFLLRRKSPGVAVGLLLFVLLLAPNLNVVWSGANDALTSPRFLYLPAIGLAFALAESVKGCPRWVWLIAGGGVAVLGGRTLLRSTDFLSQERFWSYELRHNPDVPQVLQHVVALDAASGNPGLAIRRAACAHGAVSTQFVGSAQGGMFILQALEFTARRTPDGDRATLEQISSFLEVVVLGRQDATLARPFALRLSPKNPSAHRLRELSPSLDMLRAEILVRLGDPVGGSKLAERAVERCPRCRDILIRSAETALRVGDLERAQGRLEGLGLLGEEIAPGMTRGTQVAQVRTLTAEAEHAEGVRRAQLLTTRASVLGLWGLALSVLLPERDSISRAGAEAQALLAEVAARAGRDDIARAALSRHFQEPAIDAMLVNVQRQMGFVDRQPTSEAFVAGGCALGSELR